MSTEPFTHPVCKECGSDDVTCDGTATYNKQKNEWQLAGTFDGGYCNHCDDEQKFFNWIDTPYEIAAQRTNDEINISMSVMKESNGRVTYMTIINRNGKQIETDHSQRKNRVEYEFARWKHLLLDGPEPDLMEYPDEEGFVEIPYT